MYFRDESFGSRVWKTYASTYINHEGFSECMRRCSNVSLFDFVQLFITRTSSQWDNLRFCFFLNHFQLVEVSKQRFKRKLSTDRLSCNRIGSAAIIIFYHGYNFGVQSFRWISCIFGKFIIPFQNFRWWSIAWS